MNARVILFGLTFILTLHLRAQTIISVSGGPNFPGGDLASQDEETLASGFAKTGLTFDISASKLLYKKLGLISSFRYQRNNFDKKQLQGYGSVTADPWRSLNISLGPCFELTLSSKLSIDLGLQGGYFRTASRMLNVSGSISNVTIDQKAAGTFSTLSSVGLKYNLINNLFIGVKVDYLSASQSFKAKYKIDRYSIPGDYMDRSYKMDMHSISAQIKISYRL